MMSLLLPNTSPLAASRSPFINSLLVILFSFISMQGLAGCGDVSTATAPPALPAGPGPLTITTSSLPDGTVNQPYATTVGGSGGVTPYTWSVTPTLPANLTFDQTTGTINGTAVAEGDSTHTFTLQDSSSPPQTVQKSLSLSINSAPPILSITNGPLPNGGVGQAYNQTVQATGGTGALTWSIINGTLPQNLSLDPSTGVISGTPTATGLSSFTLRVADTSGQADTQGFSILINSSTPPNITTLSLPGGTVGLAYSQTIQATGGTGTLVWSLTSGSLPSNLALSQAGTIFGTPTNAGTSNFAVRVTDQLSQADTQPLSIIVSAALTITTNSLPNAKVARSYSTTLQRSGGLAPFTWSVTPALPAGLTLNASSGVISGTPGLLTSGTYSRTFTLVDSTLPTNQTTSKVLQLKITP